MSNVNPDPGHDAPAFIPLEANPPLMTDLVHKLGLSPTLAIHDVYSLTEPDLLAFIPRPALALLLVFPISAAYESQRLSADSLVAEYAGKGAAEPVVWWRQTIRNACGMMGLLHAVSNGPAREFIGPPSTRVRLDPRRAPPKVDPARSRAARPAPRADARARRRAPGGRLAGRDRGARRPGRRRPALRVLRQGRRRRAVRARRPPQGARPPRPARRRRGRPERQGPRARPAQVPRDGGRRPALQRPRPGRHARLEAVLGPARRRMAQVPPVRGAQAGGARNGGAQADAWQVSTGLDGMYDAGMYVNHGMINEGRVEQYSEAGIVRR
ncbi:ubiquitin carboxyl-terminal hydrolase, family 1 [Cordyceps javanica]|nr:ubiquitin carboxyl-terminal hydrolase, family 1 [Cordyceps javanica]